LFPNTYSIATSKTCVFGGGGVKISKRKFGNVTLVSTFGKLLGKDEHCWW